VKPIVMDAVDAVAQEISRAQHQLHVELPDEAVWIHGDPERLVQVLLNLLTNAARYTPANGQITIGVRAEGSEVVFLVRDNGAGLTPADAERVFDMFVQVGNEGQGGLGIGLALVKGLAELHGGTVAVHSEGPGRGSEFVIRLPRVLHPVAPADAPASPPRERPCTILVVDDNVDAVDTLRAMLELRGHRVAVAHTAADAFDLAVEMRPEIGLLDLGLPGTDGFVLARRLREEPTTAAMLLVAITGWGQDEHRRRSQAAGFDAHLTKPADPEALVTLIAERYPADGSAPAAPSP
jgi:CheY-like chemotaxis protein/anti-sigma regulatory factor (Ser/Thr protein kinase)